VWPERLCQRKIALTPLGIEPVNIRFLTQCLNELSYRVPQMVSYFQFFVPKLHISLPLQILRRIVGLNLVQINSRCTGTLQVCLTYNRLCVSKGKLLRGSSHSFMYSPNSSSYNQLPPSLPFSQSPRNERFSHG
jgi:hypothetical protein